MNGLFRLFVIFIFSLLSKFLISCGGGSSNELPKTDTTEPTVIVSPEAPPTGQTVPVTTVITATFNENMNAKSVEDGFIVVPNNNGTILYDSSTKTATYNPDPNLGTDLLGDTEYTVTLKNTIKDKSNNPLKEKIWLFNTEDNVNPKLVTCIPKCDGT